MSQALVARVVRTLFDQDDYQVVAARTSDNQEVVLTGRSLRWGAEGFLAAEGRFTQHPRYGRRFEVAQASALSLEALLHDPRFRQIVEESLVSALEMLYEAGHTAYPLEQLAQQSFSEKSLLRHLKNPLVTHRPPLVGLTRAYETELRLTRLLQRRGRGLSLLPPQGHRLSQRQARIFQVFTQGNLATLTGGPGTGKSFTVASLLQSPTLQGKKVALAAPTGKAAKRLEELAGRPALTVHRLLGVYLDQEGQQHFRHHGGNPLEAHLVVVDESSMLDVPTFYALIAAISPFTLLLLVGDPYQLPPVGPGEPFADSLGVLPGVHLTEVRRQGQDSPIVRAARLILEGHEPLVNDPENRYRLYLYEARAEEIAAWSVRLYLEARKRFGQVALLTATNTGPLGVLNLNRILQNHLNPSGPGVTVGGGLLARLGDPLVMTRNDYLLELMNGEILTVTHVDTATPALGLEASDGRTFRVEGGSLGYLLHAYAMSVHRSQGSEWPVVIIALHEYQENLLSRELLYTALTRSKERAYIFTTPKALYRCRSTRAGSRQTWLKLPQLWGNRV